MNRMPEPAGQWASLAADALGRMRRRQAATVAGYGLGGDVRIHWSLEYADIVWSRRGRRFLHGRITVLGTAEHTGDTWRWSWAQTSMPEPALGNITEVRAYGEKHSFPPLTSPVLPAGDRPAAQARVVAADLLDAEALWFLGADDADLHFTVHDLRRI